MWGKCPCTDCTVNNFNYTNGTGVNMGSFPVIHGFLSLAPSSSMGNAKYPDSTLGLRRSATCGYLPHHTFAPVKGEWNEKSHSINGRLPITNGKAEYTDDDDTVKAKLMIHNANARGETSPPEEVGKKTRDYSDDSLTPDSSLPAVIRRRNRNRRKKLATSMVEPTPGGVGWEAETVKPPPRTRSHSISDDQWAQVMAAQPGTGESSITTEASSGPTCPPGHTPADMSVFSGVTPRRSYAGIPGGRGGGTTMGRGMVSSASVCDLNTLSQQQPPQAFNGTHGANSFQQLNMMGYGGGMMWGAPCDMCQAASAYPGHSGAGGMKRTASNLSMNLSSVGSDMTGYPWAAPPPHVHHHMPMYPGYYPGYHPHMVMPTMGAPMGLNVSIPDSMHTFGKVPSSPAPSVRSTSHRSHKSSKSRSFSAADASGRRSRNRKAKRSEESEESRSSSGSDDGDYVDDRETKSTHSGGNSLAWQCDHCTFINNGGTRTCGMCSKTLTNNGRASRRGSERRRSERRRDRRTDHEEDDKDLSDYDNQDSGVVKSNFSFSIKDSKRENRSKISSSNKSKSKKKSRRRDSSASVSGSESEGEEEERLERHMRDLRVSSRRKGNDYDGVNGKDNDKGRDRTSRKKEGKLRWKD